MLEIKHILSYFIFILFFYFLPFLSRFCCLCRPVGALGGVGGGRMPSWLPMGRARRAPPRGAALPGGVIPPRTPAVLPVGVSGGGVGARQPPLPVTPCVCPERAASGSASGLGAAQVDGRAVGWAVRPLSVGVWGERRPDGCLRLPEPRSGSARGTHCPALPTQRRSGGAAVPQGRPRPAVRRGEGRAGMPAAFGAVLCAR